MLNLKANHPEQLNTMGRYTPLVSVGFGSVPPVVSSAIIIAIGL